MIPRTKYLVVSFAAIAFIVASVPFLIAAESGIASLSLFSSQTALVIQSEGSNPGVVVVEDTIREDTRHALIEKLRSYNGSREEEVSDENDQTGVAEAAKETPASPEADEPEERSRSLLSCAEGRVSGSETNSWGPVSATIAEGARIIASKALGDNGMPLSVLQLPLNPNVTGNEACLPEGMVGILLDGTVVKRGQAVSTNAEGLAGFALDGFGVFGSYEDGGVIEGSTLDECHGHVHPIVWDGKPSSMYHYHVTEDTPYSLGCFRGTPTEVE